MGGSDIEYEMNCPSSGMSPQPLSEKASEMTLGSVSILNSSVGADTFMSSSFGASATASLCEFSCSLENEGVNTTSHLLYQPSSLSFDMFGSGSFSEMVGTFGFLTEGDQSQIANIKCPFSYVPNLDVGGSEEERVLPTKNNAKTQLNCESGSSANEKRTKLVLGSISSSRNKNAEGSLNVEPFENVSEILKKDDKTLKVEHRMCANFNSKPEGNQPKKSSQSVHVPKENYIHVRAQRGKATNSHSLAERVRREKITERMKLLQELVPGCNQITGKTMKLDEIIKYVQSLQQQVEFLSMKLANVSSESNLDTEQILFTDNSYISSSKILRMQSEGVDRVLAVEPRLTTSHTTPHAVFQFHGPVPTMPRTSQQHSSLSMMKQ